MLAVHPVCIRRLNSPVAQIMESFITQLQDVKISRLSASAGTGPTQREGRQRKLPNPLCRRQNRSITLNGIDFRYDLHALKNTLDNITFTVPQEQVTAIVGGVGQRKDHAD